MSQGFLAAMIRKWDDPGSGDRRLRGRVLLAGPWLGYGLDGQAGGEDRVQPAGKGPVGEGDCEGPVLRAYLVRHGLEGPRVGDGALTEVLTDGHASWSPDSLSSQRQSAPRT